jgi:hypothetical protein
MGTTLKAVQYGNQVGTPHTPPKDCVPWNPALGDFATALPGWAQRIDKNPLTVYIY